MCKINIKSFFSIMISKIVLKLSKTLFKGGTNFPGRVALKLDRKILKTVAKDYKIILVTGTNGKTTTTSMIYNMIKDSNKFVISNSTGANMFPGIVACFVENFSFNNKEEKYAIIEVDEANVKFITEYVSPEIITITNLFRDQLDRYGEVYTTLKKILEGIEKSPNSKLILNGDESLLGDLNNSLPNKVLYYGFSHSKNADTVIDVNADSKFCKKCKHPYSYEFLTYNHLGNYYCESCGYKRPNLTFSLDEVEDLTPEGSLVIMDNQEYYINQPGLYNVYNALCAYSMAKTLGIEKSVIFNSLKSQKSSFGRQESINIEGKDVKIILVKNPAGYDQAINTIVLDKKKINLALLLNDNYADGRDVSWIWDVKFEKLNSLDIDNILISGVRLYDMAIRLKIAGLPNETFKLSQNHDDLLEDIKSCKEETVYILATYTAMTSFRKFLNSKGYIKNLW
ncbi:Mur ligase family protein [Clostridium sporogenes]|uniref:MurT ligase domain-containing protein n=1 Tax=Clostridium sporogenes TaxID=1509 RepID=UPI001C100F6B|nr:Mur ligase family protein [Clostridium sporogenes]